jgi:dienelactone hydrolase
MNETVDLTALAESLCLEMARLDFDSCYARFGEGMKAALTQDALRDTWASAAGSLGEFDRIYSSFSGSDGRYFSVTVIMLYELRGLSVCFTFSDGGVIEGLFVNYYSLPQKPEATDKYAEKPARLVFDGGVIDGMLTLPSEWSGDIIVMLQGSGQTDMNETVGSAGNAPFRDLAHLLAERGAASLRFNKRYYQYPALASGGVTVQSEVLDDADSAVSLAASVEGARRVYILGHSLGGMLAPVVADRNRSVSGMISLAGSPRRLQDIVYSQYLAQLSSAGYPEEMLAAAVEELDTAVKMINGLGPRDSGTFLGTEASYWYSLNRLQPALIARELDIPMLFMQGSADFQIDPETDLGGWKRLLSGKANVSFKEYEGLNHLFMPTNGYRDERDYSLPGSVAPAVADDIVSWLSALRG